MLAINKIADSASFFARNEVSEFLECNNVLPIISPTLFRRKQNQEKLKTVIPVNFSQQVLTPW